MKLEDTITRRLFTTTPPHQDYVNSDIVEFILECKGNRDNVVPLCIDYDTFFDSNLIYSRLCFFTGRVPCEKSTPRSMYNRLFDAYYSYSPIMMIKIKGVIYYSAHGVLFDADKSVLFWFGYHADELNNMLPRLYLTPKLLSQAAASGRPMEKFFMSTVVPYLIDHDVRTSTGHYRTVIEIDNHPEDTFFVPGNALVTETPADMVNSVLGNILADNADMISSYIDNY